MAQVLLNHFQRKMLGWDAIHPFNAAHAVRMDGPADPGALRAAASQVCARAGVGTLGIDRKRHVIHYLPMTGEIPLRIINAAPAGLA